MLVHEMGARQVHACLPQARMHTDGMRIATCLPVVEAGRRPHFHGVSNQVRMRKGHAGNKPVTIAAYNCPAEMGRFGFGSKGTRKWQE